MLSRTNEPGSVTDLTDHQQYDAAIAKLNSIPEDKRTENDLLSGAYALLFRMDWPTPSRKEELRQALSLLNSMDKRYARNPTFCYLMGTAYYQLEEFKEAAAWFKKAPDTGIEPTKEQILRRCRDVLDRPQDKESFRSRVQKAWEAFASEAASLCQMGNDAMDNPKVENQFISRMNKLLGIAFEDPSWSWYGGEPPILQMDSDQCMGVLLAQQYFVSHAPKEVSDHWELYAGQIAPTDEELTVTPLWDMDVQISTSKQGISTLTVYHPSLDPGKVSDKAKVSALEAIVENLGEQMFLSVFDTVDYRGMPPEGPTMKLGQLLPVLEVMGYGTRQDTKTLLSRRREYISVPEKHALQTERRWRQDVIRGTSIDPTTAILFRGRRTMSKYSCAPTLLAGNGAVPGFVVFPLMGQTDNPSFLMQNLLQELDDTMDPEIALVLGNAEGLQFGYLDLIAWDLQPALDAAASLLRNHKFPWACWHSFFTEDRTVQLF